MKKIGLILVTGMFCLGLWSQARVAKVPPLTQGLKLGRISCNKLKPLKQRVAALEKNLKALASQKNNLKNAAARSKSIIGLNKLKSLKFVHKKSLFLRMNDLKSESLRLVKIKNNARSHDKFMVSLMKELKSIQLALYRKYRRLKFNRLCLNPLLTSLKRSSRLMSRLRLTKIKFILARKNAINLARFTGPRGRAKPVPKVHSTDLGDAIKKLETEMEQVRNKRQEFQTMFENFDQKANQLFNILSTVIKSINEMRTAASRNML